MKLKYDSIEIEANDLAFHLEQYAKGVMLRMQKADPEFADCWTACSITFSQLQPEFEFGSIEDICDEDGIYVELAIT